MQPHSTSSFVLLLLAAVFTVGLTFASLELPYRIDQLLQDTIATPGFDSHANSEGVFKTELFIRHYHLRTIGYSCFGLTLVLIIAGFATRRSGLAAAGAIAFMLPVFAQFAGVMFFLAGLGLLNVIWLPVLDISVETQKLGQIIRLPFDLLMWLFRQAGANAYWPLVYFFILAGLLLFFLGTFAWLLTRARGSDVANFWVYRFSRHPQYLGWILWSYGIYLMLLQMRYPKRSWGIDASLPWLLSTMVIIGVALSEELEMRKQFGERYREYRSKTPFLFPIPRFAARLLYLPLRIFHRGDGPQHRRDVVFLVLLYTILLIGASALFYAGGWQDLRETLQTRDSQEKRIVGTIERMVDAPNARQRYFLSRELAAMGDPAIPHLLRLLQNEDPELRKFAAEILGELQAGEAIGPLISCLRDSSEDVKWRAAAALGRIGSKEATQPLLLLLGDPKPPIRLTAAYSLAQVGAFGWIDRILPDLKNPRVWIRVRAVEVLARLGSQEAVTPLLESARDEDPQVRRAAIVALMKIGSPLALETVQQAASDPDWEVRLYAAEALEQLLPAPAGHERK